MNEHSPEPWKWQETGPIDAHIVARDGTRVIGGEASEGYVFEDDPNIQRIVACVNACQHLPTEYLEWLAAEERFLVGTSIKSTAATIAKFEQIIGEGRVRELAPLYSRVVKLLLEDDTHEST